jgi:16S rRNA (uracil1498-N3)-methyltransferase
VHRIYVPELATGGVQRLGKEEATHLVTVKRVAPGERAEAFDGLGLHAMVVVRDARKSEVTVECLGPIEFEPQPVCQLTLATASPKGDRLDWLVEKATELGVARIQLLRTRHSVVDPREPKRARLERRVIEACKQSGRNRLMAIAPAIDSGTLFEEQRATGRFIAEQRGLALSKSPESAAPIAICVAVGPEGGWSPEELGLARRLGWRMLGLGRYRLRVETAGLAAAALILGIIDHEGDS